MQARHPSAGRGPICIAVALLFAVLNASAASYQPQQQVRGDIRIWGSPADGGLVKAWGEGFRKHHRDARVVASLHGPESALASLYCDVADIAFIGRELRIPTDNMAFQWVKLYRPTTVEIANAGFQASRPPAGLTLFVHPRNPIAGLSAAQLDAIFDADRNRGSSHTRTWDDVRLGGERDTH